MSHKNSSALVIGRDSVLGSAIFKKALDHFQVVRGTTRRDPVGERDLYFDMASSKHELLLSQDRPEVAFICAGVARASACEASPDISHVVNVTATLDLVTRLLNEGVFVVWLSSNSVFSGSKPLFKRHDTHSPITEYGRQKAAVEKSLRRKMRMMAIVRLTKVLHPRLSLLEDWTTQLRSGGEIFPYYDAFLCPVSLEYAVDAIVKVGVCGLSGIQHLSGARDISYADLAQHLAVTLSDVKGDIRPVRKNSGPNQTLFTGKYSSLDMTQNNELLDVGPQLLDDVILDITRDR